jgi:serine/threonine-protein kinase HipA
VCISNVDHHRRNHGFVLEKKGLGSGAGYDMNPVAHGDGLTLNISETDNAQDLELKLDVATHFRVKAGRAKEISRRTRSSRGRRSRPSRAVGSAAAGWRSGSEVVCDWRAM